MGVNTIVGYMNGFIREGNFNFWYILELVTSKEAWGKSLCISDSVATAIDGHTLAPGAIGNGIA